MIAPSYTVNCSILLTHLPLLERPAAARRAGFSAVEFWWPFDVPCPPDREVDAFVGAVRDAGVRLSTLNFAAGDLAAGERGLLSDPRHRRDFLDNVDVVVGIGEQLGATGFNALPGNRRGGLSADEQDELAVENLGLAARAAERIGATVLLEPLSGAPRYPIRTPGDAVTLIDRVESAWGARLGLLADLYHWAVNEVEITAAIDKHRADIRHVQVADFPGRGAPGTGTVPLREHVEDLRAGGYDGWVSLEYLPGDATGNGHDFAWMREWP
ncbi:TIM barrel protein [Hoyosella sp. G463]|uniref:TIM barrel protein n=1 Tax=Lolliginicoccus lacisalsi TaxID=2742202 RepID=A0A927PLZ4_9ACTN|nr:TIM barrel protein [Lolliginicoccus lacisalsi]MBD8505866.1 TIM barrel protein [Lolliginicoccus lacisalsi]